MSVKNWVKNRLKERSTRVALAAIAGSFGWVITPDQIAIVAPVVVGIIGTIEAFIPDEKS
jgi:hypothetical protein